MSRLDPEKSLSFCLFLLRVTVALVMVMWTLDKFVNTEHAIRVYQHFYLFGDISKTFMHVLGGLELAILVGFLAGLAKPWTYGFVLAFHAISTFSSYQQYFSPFESGNLLFFAAWPMLAACVTLFLLREEDTWLTCAKKE